MRWLLVLLLAGPAYAAELDALDWQQHPGAPLPLDAPLLDAHGPATLRGVAHGLPLILVPGYFHCPNLCGVVRDDLFAALARTTLRPGRDIAVALVTIDPAETPADAASAVAGLLDRYPGLDVHPLTGPPASLAAVAQAAGFQARRDPGSRDYTHPAGLALATPDGRISGYLLGVGYQPADLEAAIARARDGVLQAAEPIHLFCFTYDPVTGRLSVAVMEALRGAAILTVAGIGIVLFRLRRA